MFGLGIALANAVILALLRLRIPHLFSEHQVVVDILTSTIPTIIFMQAFDTLSSFSNSLLRGMGSQAIGGYVNIVALYFVALPMSLGTAFGLGWELNGLWLGLTSGFFL